MNCPAARERILAADPAELEAGAESPLGRHLRDCGECRAAARRVLVGMALLDRGLAAAPRRTVDEALVRLRRERTRSPHRLVPWAAAAAILVLVLVSRPWEDPAPIPGVELASGPPAPVPVIEDAGGAGVAMFSTTNPQITVVWLYQENPR